MMSGKRKRIPFGSSQHANIQRNKKKSSKERIFKPKSERRNSSKGDADENREHKSTKASKVDLFPPSPKFIGKKEKIRAVEEREDTKFHGGHALKNVERDGSVSIVELASEKTKTGDRDVKQQTKHIDSNSSNRGTFPQVREGKRCEESSHDMMSLRSQTSPFNIDLSPIIMSPSAASKLRRRASSELAQLQKKLFFNPTRSPQDEKDSDRRTSLERYLDDATSENMAASTSKQHNNNENISSREEPHPRKIALPVAVSKDELRQLQELPADDPNVIDALLKSTKKEKPGETQLRIQQTELQDRQFLEQIMRRSDSKNFIDTTIICQECSDEPSVLTLDTFFNTQAHQEAMADLDKMGAAQSSATSNTKPQKIKSTQLKSRTQPRARMEKVKCPQKFPRKPAKNAKISLTVVHESSRENDSRDSHENKVDLTKKYDSKANSVVVPILKPSNKESFEDTIPSTQRENGNRTSIASNLHSSRNLQRSSGGGSCNRDRDRQSIPTRMKDEPSPSDGAKPSLPPGWIMKRSTKTKKPYYVHVGYGSQWDHPLDKKGKDVLLLGKSTKHDDISILLHVDNQEADTRIREGDSNVAPNILDSSKSSAFKESINTATRMDQVQTPKTRTPAVDLKKVECCGESSAYNSERLEEGFCQNFDPDSLDDKPSPRHDRETVSFAKSINQKKCSDLGQVDLSSYGIGYNMNSARYASGKIPSHAVCFLQQLHLRAIFDATKQTSSKEIQHATTQSFGQYSSRIFKPGLEKCKSPLSFIAEKRMPLKMKPVKIRRRRRK